MGLLNKIKDAQQQLQHSMGAVGVTGGIGAGMTGGSTGDLDEKMRYRQLAQKLSASGIKAPAVIKSITRGDVDALSGSISTTFEVMIKPDDGDAYPATITQAMLPAGLDTMAEGDAYTVRYDPDDRSQAMIYGQI
jgi:hypothetical protein